VRRILALLAIGVLVLAVASDLVIGWFWIAHPMLTSIVSALVVILLTAAVIDVILRRRDERRWRVLAQSALIQLAEAAHTTWSNLAEDLGLGALGDRPPTEVRAELTSTDRAPAIHQQAASGLSDPPRREHLDQRLTRSLEAGQVLITRWAVPMTGSDRYAAVFDRHVEMYGRVEGLVYFLRYGYRMMDPRGQRGKPRREYQSAGGEQDDEWFLDNVLATLNVAVSLEDETWGLALRVVPSDWWDQRTARLAAAAHPRARSPRRLGSSGETGR
jgi:hypothetical protein